MKILYITILFACLLFSCNMKSKKNASELIQDSSEILFEVKTSDKDD